MQAFFLDAERAKRGQSLHQNHTAALAHLLDHPRLEGGVEQRRGEPGQHPTHHEPAERGVQHQDRGARLQRQAGHAPDFVWDKAAHDALEQHRERQLRGHAGEVHPDNPLLWVYLAEVDEQVGRLKPLRQESDQIHAWETQDTRVARTGAEQYEILA